ncbi:hypothetical protein HGA34_02085 [Candidatus Falkowbacteria bacterium]|nr:hypothetical protein [Candidatus Falkowbacteria bacterium]
MSTISDKVLDKIKKEHIMPRPRWQFWLRDGGRWAGFIMLSLLAAFALGLLWYFWSDGPWLHGGRSMGLFFSPMPLVFLGLIALGWVLALVDFSSTGRGYRYPLIKIGVALLLLAVISGWALNFFGVSQRMDRAFSSSPLYQDRESYMKSVWQRPSEGLLAGEISSVGADGRFTFRDFDGHDWLVDGSRAIWRHGLAPAAGVKVKLIGTPKGDGFTADDVRPWMGPGSCGMMQNGGSCGMMR